MTTVDNIPDIERAACTILAEADVINPVLRAWIRRMTADPDYCESLETVEIDERMTWFSLEYVTGRQAFGAILGYVPLGTNLEGAARAVIARYPEWTRQTVIREVSIAYVQWLRELAVLRLAWATAQFRLDGRPSGDQTTDLGAEITITSSLAASVAAYARTVAHLGSSNTYLPDVAFEINDVLTEAGL